MVARQFARRLCEASLRTIVDDRYRRFLQPGASAEKIPSAEKIDVPADRLRFSAWRHVPVPLDPAWAR
jgi:hypothetical protein